MTPEAVKDIFLLGVSKGVEGLTDVAKHVPMPYELDDKFVGAIASRVGWYFVEIGYTPNGDAVPLSEKKIPSPDTVPLGGWIVIWDIFRPSTPMGVEGIKSSWYNDQYNHPNHTYEHPTDWVWGEIGGCGIFILIE